ncbi:hypothetical protein ILUMI_22425 [Ignelater luminosus]|uniref:Uncharacterized protein n=1 Tax=Ignelater luminosus TaxID=2038154 RepID=A0A8K0CDX6_IGNLU|nr:hypothetical protein ILUMI_22425 [Ignelater luminosus]
MPTATLLLREPAVTSLTSIVEKSQQRKPPLPEYDLRLDSCQLDFVLISEPEPAAKLSSTDEGFESDVDTLSIVSSDDSFTSGNLRDNVSKIQETDSANGSASSDSDTEAPTAETLSSKVAVDTTAVVKSGISNVSNESYHLVDCMCYTDIKFPNILVFVVKGDALVFRFENLDNLKNFYTNFSTFKAIANQKIYSNNFGTKFNLLQRTDKNGITHIEITKEPETRLTFPQKCETSNIISLNTPETDANAYYGNCGNLEIKEDVKNISNANVTSHNSLHPFNNIHKESRSSLKDANSRQRSESPTLYDAQSRKEFNTKNSHSSKVGLSTSSQRSASTENILNLQQQESTANSRTLENVKHSLNKKIWNSAEDLLDASPKRPDRRRKPKAKAPQPPSENNKNKHDVLKGQYVRVNVTSSDIKPPENIYSRTKDNNSSSKLQKMLPTKDFSLTLSSKPKTFQQFRYVEPKRLELPPNRTNTENSPSSWTYSVPRFLRKPRSHSETRNFTPMAYRYIDTTNKNCYYGNKNEFNFNSNTNNVSNRLFGMSSKLKDFSNDGTMNKKRYDEWENRTDVRRGSLGELTYKINSSGGSLKSVIKKGR